MKYPENEVAKLELNRAVRELLGQVDKIRGPYHGDEKFNPDDEVLRLLRNIDLHLGYFKRELVKKKLWFVPHVIFLGRVAFMCRFSYLPVGSELPWEISYDADVIHCLYKKGELPRAEVNKLPFTWTKQEIYDLGRGTRIDFPDYLENPT